jgi:UDP-N-acetylglucosamine 2-epimerase
MMAFEKVCIEEKPDWVVVVGDVNATLACSVTAKKLNIKVCHIEAGLRSGDMTMPEEINRLVTDRLSDLPCEITKYLFNRVYSSHPINSPSRTSATRARPNRASNSWATS